MKLELILIKYCKEFYPNFVYKAHELVGNKIIFFGTISVKNNNNGQEWVENRKYEINFLEFSIWLFNLKNEESK